MMFSIAMASGVFAIRGHAYLNELDPADVKWWIVMLFSVLMLWIFISSIKAL